MMVHDRAFADARPLAGYRLPATSAELRHWFAEVLCDAPFGSAGLNAQLSRLAEGVEDRRARHSIEGGVCGRRALVPEIDRRYRRRAW
ncbi:hypothetical protein [Shinella zoogloeoides]|uniref:hypothetical protein n=1 Tax=Shinella zoogloeoides TaxID=352475 RepID=UPI0028AB00D2|nr:hypothetical protein [Shinella zoogloeoides]